MNSNNNIFELIPERWVAFDKSLFFNYEKIIVAVIHRVKIWYNNIQWIEVSEC